MIEGLLGKKIGMTHLFGEESTVVPVTVLEVGPCVVTQVRTETRDGYQAVQLGFGQAKQLNKPSEGHLKASGDRVRHLREFSAPDPSEYSVGQRLDVSEFKEGDLVDIVATTKGRGFQGAMKRHNYSGGPKTHGQGDRGRAVGSIGAGTFPGRVLKGKTMPGHMGDVRRTSRNLRVEKVDVERNLLLVRGSVGGARHGLIMVRHAQGAEARAAAGED
ncbi:MAG: 50S ribosomal protein L3 [Dehalococcoidia bacterium]